MQDGYQVYQHTFLFTEGGSWAVVQQGINENNGMARRYHWLTTSRFDSDPHAAVVGAHNRQTLNLVASEAGGNRAVASALARDHPQHVLSDVTRMRELTLPRRHALLVSDLLPERLERVLLKAYEAQPADYTSLLSVPGVGAKGLRALSLVAELTYGEPSSVRDPATFSFAYGGKDGTPRPVDRDVYHSTIASIASVVREAKLGRSERKAALERLAEVGGRARADEARRVGED